MSALSGARAAGLAVGVSLVAVMAVQVWRLPEATRPGAASVELRAVASGEVGVTPAGSVLRSRAVVPGGAAVTGRLRLTNRTAGPRTVHPRLTGGDAELAALVDATLTVRGRAVYRGPLGGIAGGAIALPQGGSETVVVRVSIAGSAAPSAIARMARWTLTFAGER